MTSITAKDLATILLGTEHAGNSGSVYKIAYAVPNRLLGSSKGGNNSGFSFGIVQLDIGVNDFAQKAYAELLNEALTADVIDKTQHDRLVSYSGKTRYDLDADLSSTYRSDRSLLNETVFTRQAAKNIVDKYNNLYLERSLLGKMTDFLDAMATAWGANSVFDVGNRDYFLAVAALTSIANRFGGLTQTTQHFQANQPATMADVQARFNHLLPSTHEEDWRLVQIGARLFEQSTSQIA